MKRALLIFSFVLLNLLLVSFQVANSGIFRVYPYLQLYGAGRFQLTWISSKNSTSTIDLFNDQGDKIWSSSISGTLVPEIYYTSKELAEDIPGLNKGSWLKDTEAYKYVAILPVLPSGEIFTYQISLGGETFTSDFRPVPDDKNWTNIRFVALSDSEMEPVARVNNRAWYPGNPLIRPFSIPALWKQKFGTTTEQGFEFPNYFLTEAKGFEENLKIINNRAPEFILMPGDLVQAGGYQPAWDEFFRYLAGDVGKGLSIYPILPALGNWEGFGGTNGGYGFNEKGDYLPRLGRERFHAYFQTPTNDPLQKHRQSYYRVDYGPITILTLDSNNGTPDQKASDFDGTQKLTGTQFTVPGTDTQENFTQAEYEGNGGTDLSGFGPGTAQYKWLEENLKSAKEAGQLIFVQYHHIAYSSGERGVPLNHELSIGQVGTPLRVLNPLFEEYEVIAVFSGHDELFERSFVDEDGDGKGVMYYDVGVAGDGMRGEKRKWNTNPLETLNYNPFRKWTADQNSVENWNTGGAVPLLQDGGKHYGHLEVNLQKVKENGQDFAKIKFTPVYAFPVMNSSYDLVRVERRIYADEIELKVLLKAATVVPVFKDSVKIALNFSGLGELKPSDFLVNSQDAALFTFTYSRDPKFTCADLGWKEVTVTAKDAANQTWSFLVKVQVVDELAPFFDAANATYSFDPVIGKVTIALADFDIVNLQENCSATPTISVSRQEITCSDIYQNPASPTVDFPVTLSSTDASGNKFSKTVIARIGNIIESKKVSVSSLDPLEDDGKSTLRLGSELEYEVLEWSRNGQVIPNQNQKEIVVNSGGDYLAKLRLSTGCIVSSKRFLFQQSSLPVEYTNDVSLSLDQSGKALLTNEAVFSPGPIPTDEVIFSKKEFDCTNIGSQKVKVSINFSPQNLQNSSTTEFWINVIVQDKLPPVLVTKKPNLVFDKVKGVLELKPEDFVASLSDNCGIKSLVLNKTKITCADYELPIDLILTATDLSGNQRSELITVTVSAVESQKISISPSGEQQGFVGTPITLTLGAEFGFVVEEWLRDGVKIVGQKEKQLTVSQSGTYKARILPTGGCLVESQSVKVTFSDRPYSGVKALVELALDATGKATLKPEQVFLTWPLADPNLDIKFSQSEFTCTDSGEKQVTVTIKNQTGQTWEEKTVVKVQDKLPPVLVTKKPNLVFDKVKGVLELKPEDFVASLSDNCGIKSLVLNKNKITCEDYELPIDLILTATDLSGNVRSELITVSVSAVESQKISISPSGEQQGFVGTPITLTLGAEFGYVVEEWLRDGVKIVGQKEKQLTVSQSGTYKARILPNGGCLVESLAVKVTFSERPYSGVKPLVELPLDASGKATLKPENVFLSWPLADPNLDIKFSQSEFTCTDLGEKQVTVTIKNQTGQTWEEKTLVKVQDKLAPILVPKNLVVNFDVTKASVALKPEDFITSLTDNCGLKEVTINKTTVTCEDLGKEIPVAIRTVDLAGNVSEASAILSVVRVENQKVTITGPAQLCQGAKGTLTLNSAASFEVIRWRRNGVEIPGQTGKTLEVTESGKYHAVIRYTGACLSESSEFEVKVNPIPSGEIVADGNILRAPQGDFTYQWFRNGEKINGATARTLTVDLMGEYQVELTSTAGCVAKLKSVTLTISGLGGNWVNKPIDLKLYPNPASEWVTLELPDGVLAADPEILLYSSEGKNVSNAVQITQLNSQKVEIRLSGLGNGTYLVWVIGQNQQTYFGKLVKLD